MQPKPLAQAQRDLPELVDQVIAERLHVVITRNNTPAAVLMSADEYDSLRETLNVLADDELVRDIRQALVGVDAGCVASHDEVSADLEARQNGPAPDSAG